METHRGLIATTLLAGPGGGRWGCIRAGHFGEPEWGLHSSSCWVLGAQRKQSTALPVGLKRLLSAQCPAWCTGSPPRGQWGKGSGPRGTGILQGRVEVEEERQNLYRAKMLPWERGGEDLVSGGVRGLGGGQGDTVLGSIEGSGFPHHSRPQRVVSTPWWATGR